MKSRVQTDIYYLIALIVVITTIAVVKPSWYGVDPKTDVILDFLGFLLLAKGIALRMIGRGHKKACSQNSQALVTSGIYNLVRNPMYLGTFLICLGFIFIIWPLWSVPIFCVAFYLRFKKQIAFEENFLRREFGKAYDDYCKQVPRFWPSLQRYWVMKFSDMANLNEAFSTKEKRLLVVLPLVAVILGVIQNVIVFGSPIVYPLIILPFVVAVIFTVDVWLHLKLKK